MLRTFLLFLLIAVETVNAAAEPRTAIVTQDNAALRAAPRETAQQHAALWQGELVEVRGERADYLHVYEYRRERGGYLRANQLRRLDLSAKDAPELLAVIRFLRDTRGTETLGIGFVAAYLRAAPADALASESGIEALDALAGFADGLARRASARTPLSKSAEAVLSAHLEVAARYGIVFTSVEHDGRMQICYDGEAYRRVLAMPSNAEQRARAALALTRAECFDPNVPIRDRHRLEQWRAEVLDRVDAVALAPYLRNRVLLRRANVWGSLAYRRARDGADAATAANRSIVELMGVVRSELVEEDLPAYNDAVMRVSASRWAAIPAESASASPGLSVASVVGREGETCARVVNTAGPNSTTLAERCTFGIIWTASATRNREGTAIAVAVQQTESWLEQWIFSSASGTWSVNVLPPAAINPELGYVEVAGWLRGGTHMLVAREARGEGKYRRSYEVVRIDTLATDRQAREPKQLEAFQRWQDPTWRRYTLSVR